MFTIVRIFRNESAAIITALWGLGTKPDTAFASVQIVLDRILGRALRETNGAQHRFNRHIGRQETRLFRGCNNQTARSAHLVSVLAAEESRC
jgi:hypothetical protein